MQALSSHCTKTFFSWMLTACIFEDEHEAFCLIIFLTAYSHFLMSVELLVSGPSLTLFHLTPVVVCSAPQGLLLGLGSSAALWVCHQCLWTLVGMTLNSEAGHISKLFDICAQVIQKTGRKEQHLMFFIAFELSIFDSWTWFNLVLDLLIYLRYDSCCTNKSFIEDYIDWK